MTEEILMYIDDAKEQMGKAIAHLEDELSTVRAGKANPALLSGIYVEYYGSSVPLQQVANISTPDARTLMVKPFEKNTLQDIEKAIQAANIGLNPQNDGEVIRMNIPMLTEERRKELVKKVKLIGEQSKVSIRSVRREANENIKALEKEGVSEDMVKDGEAKIQEITNEYTAKVDKHLAAKEAEIMTV